MERKPKSPRRRAVEQFFVHWVVSALMVPIRLAPLSWVRGIGWLLARILGTVLWRRQRMMERNLIAVFGDALTANQRRAIRWKSIENISKTMGEMLKLPWMSPEQLQAQVSADGLAHLDAALARGKGIILITAHFGNWEYGGALLGALGYPVNVIARDAADPLTRDSTNEARRSKGVKVFGRSDVRALLRALSSNEIVAILPDQHAKDSAVRVKFLGRTADTATGPATLALRTGASVVPGFCYRQEGDHIHLGIWPALETVNTGDRDADVRANTQLINDAIGEQIRQHPEQWLWLHNRWKAEAEELGRDA